MPSVITIDDPVLVIGKNITFTGKLNNVAGGLNFTVNGVNTDTVNVTAGTYIVTASFAGNKTHKAASARRTFSINKTDVNVTINDIELVIGQNATFTGKVNGIDNNNLTFTVNGVSNATVKVVSGTYTVVATFAGNLTHNAGSATKVFTVNKTAGVIVSVDAVPVFVGTNSTIVVNMKAAESGFVVIEIEGVNYTASINNKTAKLNIGLTAGEHNVTVYYIGDNFYTEASPVTATIVVNDKLPSVITIDDPVLVIGKNTTFTGKLNNVAGGLNFTVNDVNTDTVNVTAGTYTVTASFAGNSTHKAASLTRTFSINKTDVMLLLMI